MTTSGTSADAGVDLSALFIDDFVQGLHNELAIHHQTIDCLEADTTSDSSDHRTINWLLEGQISHTARTSDVSCRDADVCGDPWVPCEASESYVMTMLSADICYSTFKEGRGKQLRFNAVEAQLQSIRKNLGLDIERQVVSSDGDNVLFRIVGGSESGPDASGNYTYTIRDYGKLTGETLELVLDLLHLSGEKVNVGPTLGAAPRAVNPVSSPGLNEATIVSVDSTPGTTTMTIDRQITAYADGDMVWQSRGATDGVLTAGMGMNGLNVLVNDFVNGPDPFHGVASTACPDFEGKVCDAGGTPRALTEEILGAFKVAVMRRGHGVHTMDGNIREDNKPQYVFFGNDATVDKFLRDSTEDERRLTVPFALNEDGRMTKLGWQPEPVQFSGIRFVTSAVHPGGRIELVDTSDIRKMSLGPFWGEWMKVNDTPTWARSKCGQAFDAMYIAFHNLRAVHRNRSGILMDLTPGPLCA